MKYNRTELGENIGFSTVTDSKFKTNSLTVRFIMGMNPETSADNVVGIGMLSDSSKKYGTLSELNEKLSSLYGAALHSAATKRGDMQILSVSSSWIDNKYAIDGEDITAEMIDVICGCIFEPNAENGKFNGESFRITKKDLLDKIEAEINNKREYAISRACQTAFRGEPAGYPAYGTRTAAENVTPESSYAAYKKMLETAQVEIMYVSPEENNSIEERFKEEFSKIERHPLVHAFRSPSPAKKSVERVSDEMEVNQSKMVIAFKTDSEDRYALRLMSMIFGETPVSKLFANVREKMSLCYYCASRIAFSKGAILVDSGVEKSNIEKAEKEILHQLDEIRNGNFSEEEYTNALISMDNMLTSVGDTPGSYSSWYFERFCEDNFVTPAEQLREYRKVTRERIIEAAKSLVPDTVYLMLNKEADA
jgi:predicted Zn-dependent peptidase